MVGLAEHLAHRAQALGVAVQASVQLVGGQGIGQCLRPLDVGDAHEGIAGGREIDAGSTELARQLAVAVAVELQPERTPRGHAQVTQPQHLIDEVEIVVQALARVGLEEGPAALALSCQGLWLSQASIAEIM